MRMDLSEAIRTWANRRGEWLALSGSENITYKELDNMANFCAEFILNEIPTKGQRIAILTKKNINFIWYLLGIIRSGNVFVLINPTLSNDQINRSLNAVQCHYYICDEVNSDLNAFPLLLTSDYTKILPNAEYGVNLGLNDESGIIFSSGTTGEPKALTRSSFSVLSEAVQWMIELQLAIGTSFMIPRPLFYTGGFILMYSSLFSGGRVILLNDISTANVLDYINKNAQQIDWAFIVPSVIREMISDNQFSRMAKNVLTMGSFIYYHEKLSFQKKYKCNLIEVWGNSEGLGTITEPDDLFTHPDSIGRPFFTDYLSVKISDNRVSNSTNRQEGILYGLSDNKFSEYIGRPELTSEVLKDGFIYSEDIGYKDEKGYYYLTGRVKDIIVINGLKVFPADIEKIVLASQLVTDCAITSDLDKNNNEVVLAVICVEKESHAIEAISLANEKLAPHEKIKRYIIVNEIPRNHGGKFDRTRIIKYLPFAKIIDN